MKKSMTRILCLLMFVVMLVSMFAACGKKTGGETPGGGDTPITESSEDPKLEPKDYQEHQFTFITREASAYNIKFLVSEGESGETLDDAIARRNALLEEKYNIKVNQLNVADPVTEVRTQVMGGAVEFDVILASTARLATMAQENLLYNLLDIEIFNWDASYWDSNSKDQLMIGDKLYFTNCALNIHTIGFCLFFNKKIVADNNLTSPHQLMKENKWTMDTWSTMVKSISKDLDMDGAMTEMDLYGSLAEHHNLRMFLYSSGVRATTNDENGYPQVTLMANADKTTKISEIIKDTLGSAANTYCMDCSKVDKNGYNHKWDYLRYLFTQDHYMFHYTSEGAVVQFKDMESEFGVAPFPKYDENQEKFQTVYPYNNSLLAIPSVAPDIDRTARILEDMNYFSTLTVLPAWYDTLLERRYTRDEESADSLKILRENCVYDIGLYYDFGGIRTKVLDVDYAKINISRELAKWKKSIESNISKTYESFLKAQ